MWLLSSRSSRLCGLPLAASLLIMAMLVAFLPFGYRPIFISPDRWFPVVARPRYFSDLFLVHFDPQARADGKINEALMKFEDGRIDEIV